MNRKSTHPQETRELVILREAVENTNEAFVTIDQDHTVLFFNKAAENIFGYCREEIIGHDLTTILRPECSNDHHAAVARYVATRTATLIGHESEFIAARKDGTTFPAGISFSVATVDEKLFFTALVRDLSERKNLEEQISRSQRLVALGQVVAEITHEIKNPLMLIGGFARQLKRAVTGDKEQGKLEIISSEVERLEKLLLELRDVYLPSSLVISEVDINNVLKDLSHIAEENCRDRRISVSLELDEKPVSVEGDEEKLKQVLLNLVKNGMEALSQGGNLTIRSEVKGDRVDIVVQDDGPGISKDQQEKIFSPFYTTKKQGSGLGLNICRRIIDEHKGCSIDLRSDEGKGAAFTISLPVVRKDR